MIELDENKHFLLNLKERLASIKDALDIPKLEKEIEELRNTSLEDGFWEDQAKSQHVLTKLKALEKKYESFSTLETELINLMELNDLLQLENDEEMSKDVLRSSKKLEHKINSLELETLLNGKYDANNAIVTIHPGARWNRISGLGGNAI